MLLSPRVKNFILDLLFPLQCLGCGREEAILCPTCRQKVKEIAPTCFVCKKLVPATGRVTAGRTCENCAKESEIYAFLSPYSYDNGLIRELIHALKYRRAWRVSEDLGQMLVSYLKKFQVRFPPDSLLIPLPLHKKRLRVRGFNQSELIGQAIAGQISDLKLNSEILQRTKNTPTQVELSGEERRQNMSEAFVVSNPEVIHGKVVILVDDVKTTGATLEEAARVLKEAGAKYVWAMTIAF